MQMQRAFMNVCETVSPAFLTYYKAEWEGKIGKWAHAFNPGAPNTNGVIESYHGVIKLLFLTSKCVGCLHPIDSGSLDDGTSGNRLSASASTGSST